MHPHHGKGPADGAFGVLESLISRADVGGIDALGDLLMSHSRSLCARTIKVEDGRHGWDYFLSKYFTGTDAALIRVRDERSHFFCLL